jgi:hypothetical protein
MNDPDNWLLKQAAKWLLLAALIITLASLAFCSRSAHASEGCSRLVDNKNQICELPAPTVSGGSVRLKTVAAPSWEDFETALENMQIRQKAEREDELNSRWPEKDPNVTSYFETSYSQSAIKTRSYPKPRKVMRGA